MNPSPDDLLWPEEVAAYLGFTRTGSVRQLLRLTRAHIRDEGKPRPTDLPLPAGERVRRTVPASPARGTRSAQDTRTVYSWRWRRGDLDVRQAAIRAGRAAKIERIRDPATGRMAPKLEEAS